jgi:hypothetical protein
MMPRARVEILRRARAAVNAYGISANDQEPSVSGA